MNLNGKTRLLIAPLDWGLGHATRCIPLIYALKKNGFEVVIGAEGAVRHLLEQEFPDLEYLELKGYRVYYSKTRMGLFFTMVSQIPKILRSIRYEYHWLEQTIKEKGIDIVISDNRYGLYNKKIFSVFLTHQLLIRSSRLQNLLQGINFYFINKFNECWVPDFKDDPTIAGDLSHPNKLPRIPLKYIGWLSRFNNRADKEATHLLILLSGPEPQRTILENKILGQLQKIPGPVLLVRGLPGVKDSIDVPSHVKAVNHLSAGELEEAILHSSYVIARSGYSTVMDLLKLKKKAILIPTPGQTEQEYLAQHLAKSNLALSALQEKFDLKNTLIAASNFPYRFFERDNTEILRQALSFDIGNR